MKRTCFLITCILFLSTFTAFAQDYLLIPENYILHKGDTLNLHLVTGSQFIKKDELKYEGAKTAKFNIYAGSKKIDLTTLAKENTSPVASLKVENEGLNLIAMARKPSTDDIETDDFTKMLEDEGFAQYSEKIKNGSKDSYREKYTSFMKALVEVEKNSANGFDKPLNDEYEIILKDNPYKGNYGDDIIAQVRLRGKALANAVVTIYTKTATGKAIFAQKLSSDKQGQVYFKLSREGLYLLRSAYMEPSKDKSADFDTWVSTYTFAFSSSNEMPNTYKEFGFGNVH